MLPRESSSAEEVRTPCAVCGDESCWTIWDNPLCTADASAWNADPRFRAADMGVLEIDDVDEICRRYRAATAAWIGQRQARAA